jgi:hypothetical protein
LRFAVHRSGIPDASPRSHGVPRRDVSGCVHVRMAGEAAGCAHEARLALARLPIHLPARRATLACELRLDLFDSSAGFVFQPTHQEAPAGPEDLSVESSLLANVPTWILWRTSCGLGHALDPEVLYADQVEAACDVGACFLRPVLTPVGLAGPEPGQGQLDPHTAVGGVAGAGEFTFQVAHPPLLACGPVRDMKQFPAGRGSRHCHAAVDAYHLAVTWWRDRIRNGRKSYMPASSRILFHPIGLDVRWYRTGPPKPYPSGLWYPNLADMTRQTAHFPLRSTPDDAEPLIPPRLAPRRAPGRIPRVEERGHCPCEISQRLLLHRMGARSKPRMLRSCLRELSALLHESRSPVPTRTPVRVLLYRQVPHVPGVGAMLLQHGLLGRAGKQPVPGHTNTVATTTDISGEVKRRLLRGWKVGVSLPRAQ